MASTSVLDTILWNLRSSDQSIREKALQSFEDYVRSSLASGKSDDGESFWDEVINRVLFPLTSMSDTPQEKLVGIAAIDKLLRSPSDDPHPTTAPASASSNPSAASTSSTNPSAKQFLYRLLRFVKNLLPDPNLQVMTAAANTYGTILRTGGQVFAETLVEIEIQQAVGYMEEQASAPTILNPNHSSNLAGSTDGVGGYGEWSGSANRARTIASQTSKLLASANATTSSTLAIAAAGLAPPPTLVIPSVLQQQQFQSPTATPLGGKAPQREKEKILAPHARIAGVLILIQIATHAPQMYYQHTMLILSRILCPLRDGCRFWVVKGSEEDCFAGADGFEAIVTEGGVRPEDDPNINPLAYARQMTSSNSSMGLSTSLPAVTATVNKTSSSTGVATSAQPQGKPNIEARDVVRRLAARLFRVTLAVIASREPGIGHAYGGSSGDMAVDSGMGAAGATTGGDSGVASRHGGNLGTSSSVSSSSMFGPHVPLQGGNGRQGPRPGAGSRTNKPLVDVATAAANDLSAYLKSVTKGDGKYADPKGRGKSSNQASGKPSSSGSPLPAGNVHRAFGALLIYRELFESGLASLAGLYADDEDEPMENEGPTARDNTAHHGGSSSNAGGKASRLVRGGIRYPVEESVSGLDLVSAPQSSAAPKLSATPQAAPVRRPAPAKIKPLDLPTEAFTYPPPYTTIVSLIFYLATRYLTSTSGSGGSGTSLLSVGTESLARMLGGPASPGGWSAYSPSSSTSAGAEGAGGGFGGREGMGASLGASFGYSGPGWSAPLSSLVKAEQEEHIRREALALLPVCAAYDTVRFEREGWFTATMGAILGAWGVVRREERGDDPSGNDSRRTAELPIEKGDRSYLVRVLGELAYAMRSSNAMLTYTWAIGIILHGSLESRVPPPEPWRYTNYYSQAAMETRVSPPPVASTPATTHVKHGSKSRVSSGDKSRSSTIDVIDSTAERGKSRAIRGGLGALGLGGKEGKAIVMPKGCISDEVVFEAIALLAMSTGNALTAMHTAGRRMDSEGNLEGEALDAYDEQLAYRRVVEKMFRFGINPALCSWLAPIVHTLPQLLGLVQEHLLNEISTILTGHGFRPLGSPVVESNVPKTQGSALTMKSSSRERSKGSSNAALIQLALATLQSFDWQARSLTPLIQDGVLSYMDSKDREVRLQASLATCSLFMLGPIVNHTSTASVGIIDEVVSRLIRVALADPDAEIRAMVLMNLDSRYDRHLAQVEHVRVLSMALNDEEPHVRLQAVRIVGRLAVLNPASVMPSLRMELIKLLTELEYSTEASSMLTTAEVLTELLKRTERLLKPYVPSLLKVCLPKAKVMYPYVSRRMIQCIGLLATISGDDVAPYFDEIMDMCLNVLQNPMAVLIKKEITLVTMGQVCANTSNVVDPYLKHPELFRILKGFLKEEHGDRTKRKVLQVMGILGAIDPFTRRKAASVDMQEKTAAAKALQQSVKTVGSQPEVFYQSVVIQALLSILADASLATNHPAVIDVILAIFRPQGLKCVPFLPQVIPAFVAMCRASHSKHQDFYVQQMSLIVQIIGSHIRNYLDEVFQLTRDLWPNPILHLPIVELIESLANAMGAEFKPYLPAVVPQLLTVFNQPEGTERSLAEVRVFQAMLSFGSAVEEYLHLILPFILGTLERPNASRDSRRVAVETIGDLAKRINLAESVSRIVQPLVRTLPGAEKLLRHTIMDTICVLLLQLGPDFAVFVPRIRNTLSEHRIPALKFEELAGRLMKGEPLPQGLGSEEKWSKAGHADPIAFAEMNKLTVNQAALKYAWSIEEDVRPEDWQRWLKQLTLELLKQSTSHALRACLSLANSHEPLARELFNAAFYSCWVELTDQNKEQLVAAITLALTDSKSADLRLRLLSLVEFMEHEDQALPINNRTLGDIAANTFAMAKALHFKEHEYLSNPTVAVVEQLIGINASLKQQDAALGLLNNEMIGPTVNPVLWYEQLDRWEDASVEYADRIQHSPDDQDAIIGRLKCLHALNEWDALGQGVEQRWPSASPELRATLAPFAAASAWVLRQWDRMDQYVAAMTSATTERSFFKAIVSVHNNQFETAASYIGKARDALVMELGPIDDYNRVYSTIVRTQLLSELEEVITYKKSADQPDRQQIIRKTWVKRLQGCQHDVDTWQRILQLRSLVISPSEDAASYIKFANLCRKAKRLNICESIIHQLLNDQAQPDSPIRASPAVVFAHLKFLWDTGDKDDSLNYLGNVCTSLAREIGLDDPGRTITGNLEEIQEVRRLLSRAFLKQGEWIQELRPEWTTELVEDVMQCYHNATQLDPKWYKAWHTWALCNFEVINHLENAEEERDDEIYSRQLLTHILAAIVGFFRSVALGGENPIQDSLRLLTLWFKFGADEEVTTVVAENVGTVSIDTWLEVVPQLIARIQTPSYIIRSQINALLTQVGRVHPQALIYPLTVASKSNSQLRHMAAEEIMDRLREHSALLVEQALTVSHELIRVAILWHELWHEYLEEASRLYFTEKRPEAMIEHLEILHRRLDEGPDTTREESFVQVHGKDLREARAACHRYLQRHESSDMDKAWDIYYAVFRRIEKQLPLLTTIDLRYVSPKLLQSENLELAVPGTYRSGKPVVRIARFVPKLSVIASKQRPRRLAIVGSDTKEYQFCLKGHEDLRQDERVMQVFSLVNTLLDADRQSFMRKLHLQGFAVIPLAPNVGLLTWVQHADTLHVLVSDYRQARKIHLQIEYRLMLQMAPEYVNLTVLQKLEVFKYALDNTTGQDLYRVLWLTSGDSEAWLERRSTYTRSLAVSSMVGHILGLGDRHPANLLLDQITGKVVHIDFGDCFEIAMHREKFPERIPFRLTRMLVSAMEVSGIEGSFKKTSEITMQVLRENREPLMAVLEAFIYDPLVSWRLTTETDTRRTQTGAANVTATATANPAAGGGGGGGGGGRGGGGGGGGSGGAGGGAAGGEDGIDPAAHNRYAGGPRRRQQLNERLALNEDTTVTDWRNAKALEVYQRVQKKLVGRDFDPNEELSVEEQVRKLIRQATALENLCQCFPGWCPFW